MLFRSDGQTCRACHSDCGSCSGSDEKFCVTCKDKGKVLHKGSCLAKCPATTFLDVSSGICRPCMRNCQVCDNTEYCLDTFGPLKVTLIADTGAHVAEDKAFTYNPRGRINSITPNTGQLGTRVVVDGFNLRGYGAAVDRVALAGSNAALVAQSNTRWS